MADNTSVITRARRINLCKITSGEVSTIPKITHIALGDAGVDANGEPLEPLETQTKLNHELKKYAIDGVEYPENTTARYTITVPREDMIGDEISEMALVDEAGVLCAIKNMFVKKKDYGVIFTFTFDDEF